MPKIKDVLTIGIVGALLFSGCVSSPETKNHKPIKPNPTSTMPPIATFDPNLATEEIYDFCVADKNDDDPLSNRNSGAPDASPEPTPISQMETLESSTERIRQTEITSNDFKGEEENKQSFNVVIVFVGYEKQEEIMNKGEMFIGFAKQSLPDLNIKYSFLTKSFPIETEITYGRLLLPKDYSQTDLVMEKISKVRTVDHLIYIVNTKDYGGATEQDLNFSMVAGENESVLYSFAHEGFGHGIANLTDEYNIFQGDGFIQNTGQFTSSNYLPEISKQARDAINAKTHLMKNKKCGNYAVFTFNDPDGYNLMGENGGTHLKKGNSLLTPFQKEIARINIQNRINSRTN